MDTTDPHTLLERPTGRPKATPDGWVTDQSVGQWLGGHTSGKAPGVARKLLGAPDGHVQGTRRTHAGWLLTPERAEILRAEKQRRLDEAAEEARRYEAEERERRRREAPGIYCLEMRAELREHVRQAEETERPGTHPELTIERALAGTRYGWALADPCWADGGGDANPWWDRGCLCASIELWCRHCDAPVEPPGEVPFALHEWWLPDSQLYADPEDDDPGPLARWLGCGECFRGVDFSDPDDVVRGVRELCEELDRYTARRVAKHGGCTDCGADLGTGPTEAEA